MTATYDRDDFLTDFGDLPLTANIDFGLLHAVLEASRDLKEKKYDHAWSTRLRRLTELHDNGVTDIATILSVMTRESTSRYTPVVDDIAQQINIDLGDFAAQDLGGKKLVASHGRYVLTDHTQRLPTAMDLLAPLVPSDADVVVEFGGGWGRNLAGLCHGLGRRDITYINCEPSPSGRAAFDTIFSHAGGVRARSREFRFESPDMGFLGEFSSVFAFSWAAIEQTPFLPVDFVDRILGAAGSVTFAMYEPVGWQQFTNITQFVLFKILEELVGGVAEADHHGRRYVYRFADALFHDNAASWAVACRYNTNLLRCVRRVVEAGRARLIGIQYDLHGDNPVNPYTLLAVTKD